MEVEADWKMGQRLGNSQTPRRNLRKQQQRRGSSSSVSVSEVDDGYDEDLYGDSEDRRALENMNELERERILDQRYEQRKQKKEQKQAKKRILMDQARQEEAEEDGQNPFALIRKERAR